MTRLFFERSRKETTARPDKYMSKDVSLGHQLTVQLMPVLMLIGAIMSLGANFWLPPVLLMLAVMAFILCWIYSIRTHRWKRTDARFLIVPIVVLSTGYLTHAHLVPAFYDQAYHLQISNRILDRWDWVPTHQGMGYSFRPEIVSGIAAVELWFTGKISTVFLTPTLLLISSAWSIQHLSEHYSNRMYGFIAGVVFCTFPVVILYGRTMLLDVAVAGMIVSVFHHIELNADSERNRLILIGILAGIIGLTKYPYLYLGGWIAFIFFLTGKRNQSRYIAAGYALILALFLIKNHIHTGWIFGPLQSQITGTFASAESFSEATIINTPNRFMSEYIGEWSILLLCVALYGTALLTKKYKQFFLNYWAFILPAIVLHGYILNFGWPRYSIPWLALLSIGIPAAIVHSSNEFGEELKRWKIPSLLIGILILTAVNPVIHAVKELQPSTEVLYESRQSWSEIYIATHSEFDDQSRVITGRDITMGLYSKTPCFNYENPEYPMLHAINKFDATHIFTQDSEYHYDIDVNSSFLFGSPIEPVKVFSSNDYTGRLWEVNSVRLEQSDWWKNTTVEINGSGVHYGDFIWLEADSNFTLLENTAVYRIYQTKTELNLANVFEAINNNLQTVLCNSLEDCSGILREDHVDHNWAVWMTKTN